MFFQWFHILSYLYLINKWYNSFVCSCFILIRRHWILSAFITSNNFLFWFFDRLFMVIFSKTIFFNFFKNRFIIHVKITSFLLVWWSLNCQCVYQFCQFWIQVKTFNKNINKTGTFWVTIFSPTEFLHAPRVLKQLGSPIYKAVKSWKTILLYFFVFCLVLIIKVHYISKLKRPLMYWMDWFFFIFKISFRSFYFVNINVFV